MPKYHWEDGEIPIIEAHSIRKHDVLREYLRQYILIVGGHPIQRKYLSLTLIDGFAGGGLYKVPSGELHHGSPLIFLKATEEAAVELGMSREFRLDAHYIFVEKERQSLEFLRRTLIKEGYESRFGKTVFLIDGVFEARIDSIIEHIMRRQGTARRCILLLDQYGYTDVALPTLQRLFCELPKAEVMLTFAVDHLIDYLTDSPENRRTLRELGVSSDICELLEGKSETKNWRRFIQHRLYKDVVENSGAKHFTNFFIKSSESNRSYWLMHLSMHPKARDVMQELHWRLRNHFVHEGQTGFFMLGYDPKRDTDLTGQAGQMFTFSDLDKARNHKTLLCQIPEMVPYTGVSLENFFKEQCNGTTATFKMIQKVVYALHQCGELEIFTRAGNKKRKGSKIDQQDVMTPRRQCRFDFGEVKGRKA